MKEIAPAALARWLADASRDKPMLLDVREDWEFQTCHIAGSKLVPMGDVPARLDEIDADDEIVVICHHGNRSRHVGAFLEQQGYAKVHNLTGGVEAWAQTVDPTMAKY